MKQERTLVKDTVDNVDKQVLLKGWVATKRDHGKLTFIDLRDRTGIVQCVGFGKMGELSVESVVEITGTVKKRPERMVNPHIATGTVEISVDDYTVLNKAEELPIQIDTDGHEIGEEVRLRYRYLDLRRDRMQKIMRLRSSYFHAMREAL